ncbi:uncharacterized protein LOC135128322 [Zophobas morio]|uniref:uncharacterized protein LOC135128322 n=1 Tax=Zophobas morio TaxID=2755281 RepID=UPI003083A913
MSFIVHGHKKIKYEPFPEASTYAKRRPITKAYSLDAVNLLISNFVDPTARRSGQGRSHFKQIESRSLDTLKSEKQKCKNANVQIDLEMDPRKSATFSRLKRKLENMKIFYPDIYYSDKNIIEMWGTQRELSQVNLELLDYDKDSPAWLWI